MHEHSIIIDRLPIRLGQFLKHAGIAGDGSEARAMISAGLVLVNGITEIRRGRQLYAGDLVQYENARFLCSPGPSSPPLSVPPEKF